MNAFARCVDIVVVGGGPAGISISMGLLAHCYCVLVIEASEYSVWRPGETLSADARAYIFQWGGVAESINSLPFVESQGIHSSWGESSIVERHGMLNHYGFDWHVDRAAFDAMLAHIAEAEGVSIMRQSKVKSISRSEDRLLVSAVGPDGPVSISCRFVIDASGRSAVVARANDNHRIAFDRLIAIIGILERVSLREDTKPVLMLESNEWGWWYSLPFPNGTMLAVCMTDRDICASSASSPMDFWLNSLKKTIHTQRRLHGFRKPNSVRVRNSSSSRLPQVDGENWIAVGDAATTYDPLSSQGIAKALRNGSDAARAVHAYLQGQKDEMQAYRATLAKEFEKYFRARSYYYAQETRWSESVFWKRRSGRPIADNDVQLDPERVISLREKPSLAEQCALERFLPISELERFLRLCNKPAKASDVVLNFCGRQPVKSIPLVPTVLALQHGIERGFIAVHD